MVFSNIGDNNMSTKSEKYKGTLKKLNVESIEKWVEETINKLKNISIPSGLEFDNNIDKFNFLTSGTNNPFRKYIITNYGLFEMIDWSMDDTAQIVLSNFKIYSFENVGEDFVFNIELNNCYYDVRYILTKLINNFFEKNN